MVVPRGHLLLDGLEENHEKIRVTVLSSTKNCVFPRFLYVLVDWGQVGANQLTDQLFCSPPAHECSVWNFVKCQLGKAKIFEEFTALHGHIFVDIYKLLEISQSGGKRKNATNVPL